MVKKIFKTLYQFLNLFLIGAITTHVLDGNFSDPVFLKRFAILLWSYLIISNDIIKKLVDE
jgi:hypothetical protein